MFILVMKLSNGEQKEWEYKTRAEAIELMATVLDAVGSPGYIVFGKSIYQDANLMVNRAHIVSMQITEI